MSGRAAAVCHAWKHTAPKRFIFHRYHPIPKPSHCLSASRVGRRVSSLSLSLSLPTSLSSSKASLLHPGVFDFAILLTCYLLSLRLRPGLWEFSVSDEP